MAGLRRTMSCDEQRTLFVHSSKLLHTLALVLQCLTFIRFQELCQVSSVEALRYLQTQVSAMVDHSDPIESASFQILMHDLITSGASIDDDDDEIVMEGRAGSPASEPWTAVKLKTSIPEERKALFQRLLRFFPAEAKEPSVNLSALIARSL
jgi:hypothetical protein